MHIVVTLIVTITGEILLAAVHTVHDVAITEKGGCTAHLY